jgi:hypothetical protein
MGVVGTWCQVCGIPVQHDHYVELEGMLGIYREPGRLAPAVPFGPEHAWLLRAVALRLQAADDAGAAAVLGVIHDGVIAPHDGSRCSDRFVWDGRDERAALHEACWELAGRPGDASALDGLRPDDRLAPYQEQLFEFAALIADGHGFMLVDPRADTDDGRRNRARIDAILRGRSS